MIEDKVSLAQQSFAVANTPLFLLRQLRVNPEVHEIARRSSSQDILAELTSVLAVAPKTLRDSVLPYVLLVGLSFKGDRSLLVAAKSLPRGYEPDWFDYILEALLQTHRATSFSSLAVQPIPNLLTAPSNSTDAAANSYVITAPK